MSLLVLTGASGSGKTTLAKALATRLGDRIDVHYFDSIGVPSLSEMIADHGSPEGWQQAKTFDWVQRLAGPASSGRHVLLEGQMRPSFLAEAVALIGGVSCRIILVDCDDATRTRRLTDDRNQPDLANPDMMRWAAYLRHETSTHGGIILDTSAHALADSIDSLMSHFPD